MLFSESTKVHNTEHMRLVATGYECICYVAMTTVIFDFMCVQSFMITHTVFYFHRIV